MSIKHQGHFARKRFGQNFLVDQGVIDSIVDTIAPKSGERMVEIGPGLAALTAPLIERLATPESPLHAVELDRDLIGRLEKRFGNLLALHAGDALAFDFGSLALEGEKPSLRIVGNLPYNISSPLLFHLTAFAPKVIDQHFMLQDEVVDRMIAVPDAASIAAMRFCSRVTGRLVGGSTGTNLWGSLRLAAEMRRTRVEGSIVTLLCDGGERYGNTYYDDGWVRAQGLDLAPHAATLERCLATGAWPDPETPAPIN